MMVVECDEGFDEMHFLREERWHLQGKLEAT